ncbi:MAG: hypothetical protein HYV17_06530 [Xanthomonadales bacterium]|nr:hypothetical protein [Xanthomonadales bacterium]
MIDRDAIGLLLREASKLTQHREFVIVGSLSILGACANPPEAMVLSIDVDLYPLLDPGRATEIGVALGQSSPFETRHGYYADAVSPALPALPEGWESRLWPVRYDDDVVGWFLDPDDAAVSKLARSEPQDLRWIREGLKIGILKPGTIESRMRDAPFLDQAEHDRARNSLRNEVARIARRAGPRTPSPK